MGKQSDVEIYVHSLRDVIFGASMLGLYFILRFPFWWLFCAHAATFLGLFFVYSSTRQDVILPTLSAAVVLAIAATDAYAFLNTICLWNRCCLTGFDTTPWSFGVRMCNLQNVYSVPSVVFLAAATVAIGFFTGIQRAWSLWSARPLMRFDVALFVLYCGIKLWLMNWRFIVRSFIASAVLVGTMGIDLVALLFVRRAKALAVLLFACTLGLDVLVVLTRTHLVHGLSGPATGQPATNQVGRQLLFDSQDGGAAMVVYSAIMNSPLSSSVQLKTAVQRRLSGAFENVRFEWNAGFSNYNSSLWAARNSLVSTWQTPAFEAPLNATVNDLASYNTAMTLSQADALWSDVLLQFGSFQQQLQVSSYLFEGAIVSATSRFNQTAERVVSDAATQGGAAVGGGAAGAAFAAACADVDVSTQNTLAATQTAMQNTAGTQNALVIATEQQNQLLLAYGPPAANIRYDLSFASALTSLRAFQESYHIAVLNSINAVTASITAAAADADASGAALGAVFYNAAQANEPIQYTSYWARFVNAIWHPILRLVFGRDMRRNVAVTTSWSVRGKIVPVPIIVDATATAAYCVSGGVVVVQLLFALIQKPAKKKQPKDNEKHSLFFGAPPGSGKDGGAVVVGAGGNDPNGFEDGETGDVAVVMMHGSGMHAATATRRKHSNAIL